MRSEKEVKKTLKILKRNIKNIKKSFKKDDEPIPVYLRVLFLASVNNFEWVLELDKKEVKKN